MLTSPRMVIRLPTSVSSESSCFIPTICRFRKGIDCIKSRCISAFALSSNSSTPLELIAVHTSNTLGTFDGVELGIPDGILLGVTLGKLDGELLGTKLGRLEGKALGF